MSGTMMRWWEIRLGRMDQKARVLCGTEALKELGGSLLLSQIHGSDRDSIITELDRMLQKNSGSYEQSSIQYLISLKRQLSLRPWYVVILDQIAHYAVTPGLMLPLREAGEDILSIAISAQERLLIIAGLDGIIASDSNRTENTALVYIRELRQRIVNHQ